MGLDVVRAVSARRLMRYGLRTMRRNPGFTAVAVTALALGIGANTAVLQRELNAVLLRPLAYADSDRLAVILYGGTDPVSPANFLDWQKDNHVFARMAAAEYLESNLSDQSAPERVAGLHITHDMLPLLGVQPLLGRMFLQEEDDPGKEREIVLGYGLWQRRFSGDSGVIGKTVNLDGVSYTIVGVMPREFKFAPFWATKAQFWVPFPLKQRADDRGGNSLRVFARLRDGVSLEEARAEMATITARMEQQFPGTNRNIVVTSLKEKVIGNVRPALLVLLGAVGFVLLIACARCSPHAVGPFCCPAKRDRRTLGAGRTQWTHVAPVSYREPVAGSARSNSWIAGGLWRDSSAGDPWSIRYSPR